MMSRALRSPRHEAIRRLLRERRRSAELTQREVAKRLDRSSSWVSDVEAGQHRVTVVEFFDFAEVLGFDAIRELRKLAKVAND